MNVSEVLLSWPHFDNEPRVQEKQQVKDQQFCISVFVACLTILIIATRDTSPDMTTVFHIQGHMVDLYRYRAISGERNFIE